jgi:hypothetical protein
MAKWPLFSLLSILLATSAQALIIGGVDMTAHDPIQRSTAAMYSPSATGPGGSLCTASLIGRNMAVTAAHCVQPGSYAPVMIFGPNVRSPDSVQRPVTGEVVNPAYGKSSGMDQGDIAVVKFGGGLPPGYKPATIDSGDTVSRGESAVLAGYGVSNASTHEGAGVLRKTSVAVANARHGKPEMIFDQSHGRGACHGDSGGPAYFQRGSKMVLGGVTNRSYPNSASDDCAHKVVYTKVAAYRPWIEQSENQLNRDHSVPSMNNHVDDSTSADVPVRSLSAHSSHRPRSLRAKTPAAHRLKPTKPLRIAKRNPSRPLLGRAPHKHHVASRVSRKKIVRR